MQSKGRQTMITESVLISELQKVHVQEDVKATLVIYNMEGLVGQHITSKTTSSNPLPEKITTEEEGHLGWYFKPGTTVSSTAGISYLPFFF